MLLIFETSKRPTGFIERLLHRGLSKAGPAGRETCLLLRILRLHPFSLSRTTSHAPVSSFASRVSKQRPESVSLLSDKQRCLLLRESQQNGNGNKFPALIVTSYRRPASTGFITEPHVMLTISHYHVVNVTFAQIVSPHCRHTQTDIGQSPDSDRSLDVAVQTVTSFQRTAKTGNSIEMRDTLTSSHSLVLFVTTRPCS